MIILMVMMAHHFEKTLLHIIIYNKFRLYLAKVSFYIVLKVL